MRSFVQQRVAQWLSRRIPAADEQALDHQKIFIFPSRFGFFFLILAGLLFVLGTNYQNNLMRLLCTFLLSLFLLHLFVSYINFARLRIKAMPHQPAFAQENGSLPLAFSYQGKAAEGIVNLTWWRTEDTANIAVQLDDNPTKAVMPYQFQSRGVYPLPRLTLRCDYPLGLYKCWTHLDLDQMVTIYPTPKRCPVRLLEHATEHGDDKQAAPGGFDEFHSLRDFQTSDPLSNVAWKQAAKSQVWMVKTFEQPESSSGWLALESSSAQDIESKISELAYQVLMLSDNAQQFGLSLPGIEIAPASGDKHKHKCLKALATYPVSVS